MACEKGKKEVEIHISLEEEPKRWRDGSCSGTGREYEEERGVGMEARGFRGDRRFLRGTDQLRRYLTLRAFSSRDQESVEGKEGRDEEEVTKALLPIWKGEKRKNKLGQKTKQKKKDTHTHKTNQHNHQDRKITN